MSVNMSGEAFELTTLQVRMYEGHSNTRISMAGRSRSIELNCPHKELWITGYEKIKKTIA